MIVRNELIAVKQDLVIVNSAIGDTVDAKSMANHLNKHLEFIYASDDGWIMDNEEMGNNEGHFVGLKNYVTTPRIASLFSLCTQSAYTVANVIRLLPGKELPNKREEFSKKFS